jgi:GrpB-like predicted nucleotidyltransferase (UPF0157 family)
MSVAVSRGNEDPAAGRAVIVVPHRRAWGQEFEALNRRLARALGPLARRIDHIGSTSVPGLPAKDVIDVQVIVTSLRPARRITDAMARIGYRARPGAWNLRDHVPAGWRGPDSEWDKLVFGPPHGERPTNVHVRVEGRANERYALLFRDYLRANDTARHAWAEFKLRLASRFATDLAAYGQLKDPATDLLIAAAEEWAAHRLAASPTAPASAPAAPPSASGAPPGRGPGPRTTAPRDHGAGPAPRRAG